MGKMLDGKVVVVTGAGRGIGRDFALAMAANVFVTTSLLTWLPTYFHRLEDLDMTRAGLKGSVIMLMAFIGAPLGGMLADLRYEKRKDSRMLFASLSSLVTGGLLWNTFVRPIEERDLRARFGRQYEQYAAHVRCWLP